MKVIAIDLGVTYVKGAYFDNEKCLTSIRKISPTNFSPVSGKHQVEPDAFVSIVANIIDNLVKKYGIANYLVCSTQMHGFVLVNKNLQAISHYHSWMDRSSESNFFGEISVLDYFKENIESTLIRRSGMPIRTGLPSINIPSYFRLNEDANKKNNSFMSIGDYVLSKLLGQSKNYTSSSNAAGSGLYDLENMDWNNQLIDELDIRLSFPILNSGVDKPMGEYKGMLVLTSIGDQQAALNGVWESVYENTFISNIATGSQVTTVSHSLKLSYKYQTRPFVDNKFIQTIPFIPAGRALNVLIRFFKEVLINLGGANVHDEDILWKKVKSILDSDKGIDKPQLVIDTDFIGSYTTTGGEISYINEESLSVSNLLVGFMHNLVKNHINGIKKITSNPLESLILTGGLSHQFPIIKKIFESKLDCVVKLSNVSEDALIGLNKLVLNKIQEW